MRQEVGMRRGLIIAIIFIGLGITILTLNSQGVIPSKWVAILWLRWSLAFSALFLITIGIFLWIWNSLHASKGQWIISPVTRQLLIPIGIAFLILGTLISIGSSLEFFKGPWTTVPPLLLNAFGFTIALISLPISQPVESTTSHLRYETIKNSQDLTPSTLRARVGAEYRDIRSVPLAIDDRFIEHYEGMMKAVYTLLTKSGTTAVAITGFSDNSTSTLAALVYAEVRERRKMGTSFFEEDELWLGIDEQTNMADLIGTLCKAQNILLPDFATMTIQNQVSSFLEILNASGKSRLVVLDRLENWQNRPSENSPGFEGCLDVLNSQTCKCRVLITCHSLTRRAGRYPLVHLKEYHVARSSGQVKTHNLLDEIYTKELNQLQRYLLLFLSIYRLDIPLALLKENAHSKISNLSDKEISSALEALVTLNFLQRSTRDLYCVRNPDVAACAFRHFMEHGSEQAKQRALKKAHLIAAKYYHRKSHALSMNMSLHVTQKQGFLAEEIWHLCQAHEWRKAYFVAKREALFSHLKVSGNKNELLELCQLFQPLTLWQASDEEAATIYRYQEWVYNQLEWA